MADESQIKTEDFLPKDLLQAPLVLTKNIETLLGKINNLTQDTLKLSSAIKDEKSTIKDVTKATQDLAKSETDLINLQKQAADVVQRETSVIGLQDAALRKLQQDFAKLRTEQERHTTEGKKLLDTIQKQNAELKKLEQQVKANEKATADLDEQFGALDQTTGGWIGNLKKAGEQLLILAKNPFFVAFAAVAGLFVAAKAASEAYYKATLEGEEALAIAQAKDEAFQSGFSKKWEEAGEQTATAWERGKEAWRELTKAIEDAFNPGTYDKWKAAETALTDIEKERARLAKEHLRDRVDDANTELKVINLLEIAKDKEEYSAKERLAAQLKGGEILREQEEGDLELAKADLELQRSVVAEQSKAQNGIYDRTKSIVELSDDEIRAIGVKGEEIVKLAALEEAYTKVESDAAAKRVSRLKLELSLRKEVIQEQVQLRQYQTDKAFNQYNANNKTPLQNLKDFAAERAKIENESSTKSIETTSAEIETKISFWKKYGQAIGEAIKLEDIDNFLGEALKTYDDFYSAVTALSNTFSQNNLQNIQAEQNALADSKAQELAIAGDNAEAKTVIEQKYTAKEKELKREQAQATAKQAQFNKITALIEAGIKEAQLIIESLLFPTPGRIAAAIAGGIQVGAIAAKQIPPVPAYAKGTPATPRSEWALTGEEGVELVEKPGQKPILTPAQPTMMFLPKGTKVSTHAETIKRLANIGLSVDRSPQGQDLQELRRAIDKQTNVIENKPFVNVSLTEGAVRLEIQRAARKERRLGSLYS